MGFNPGILVINVLRFVCCAGQVWFLRVGWVCPMLSLGFVPLGERGGISLGAGFVCVIAKYCYNPWMCGSPVPGSVPHTLTTQQSFLLTVIAVGYSRARAFLILLNSPDKLLTKNTPNFG